jgi:hypothetical protein
VGYPVIIAGTGHRPEDCGYSETHIRQKIRSTLQNESVDTIICGMAAGYDLWLGDEAVNLGIEVWAAKPWASHGPRLGDENLYARVLSGASRVVNVDGALIYPGPKCYHDRNHWMVDNATHLLAWWSGKEAGGTFACWKYAENNIPRRNLYG